MKEYVKINTLFKRDMTNKGKIILGDWSLPEFEYLQNNEWVYTEKVDGTNIRIFFDGTTVKFGGRTDAANIPATLVERLNVMFNTPERLALLKEAFPDGSVCLYGEGYGAKIQSGGVYRPDQGFVLFDVLVGEWWLQREDVEDVGKKLTLDVVPIVGAGTLHKAIEIVKDGMKSTWGDFISEGLVLRPKTELKTRSGHRLIAKIKHVDFTGLKN